jgi:hypothetical protein
MTAGDIYTVGGNGLRGFSGNGGPATGAELYNPNGLAVDGSGDLLFADGGNNQVREIDTGSDHVREICGSCGQEREIVQ